MKRVVLLVLIALLAFSSSASAAYTAESQETRYGSVNHYKYAYEVSVSGEPNTEVTVTLMYKGPSGQREPVYGSDVTVTLDASGSAVIYSPDLYCCSATYSNPYANPVVVQAQFEGNEGNVNWFYLHARY
ncbi:hypothetical protein AMS62_23640 [Bacillus sp. FJAT-18019]|uniref:PLAT domain-containing protein n=1 Tax=Paenibacillus solani TaxID=1705565 RepID=A0A0M1P606_9BACL|nr:hypothetical protein AMS62_23640 [Bacillus sp. FJAT-18019]KOR89745.1 hypothetical protein AM231_11780 [Paenibacillus solani]